MMQFKISNDKIIIFLNKYNSVYFSFEAKAQWTLTAAACKIVKMVKGYSVTFLCISDELLKEDSFFKKCSLGKRIKEISS